LVAVGAGGAAVLAGVGKAWIESGARGARIALGTLALECGAGAGHLASCAVQARLRGADVDECLAKRNIMETFSYFSYTFLNSISIEIYKLSFANYLWFLKEDTNNIYTLL